MVRSRTPVEEGHADHGRRADPLTAIAVAPAVGLTCNRYVWTVLAVTLLFGAIGWVDDYRKVIEKNSRGLPSRWKYFWQSVFGPAPPSSI